MGSVIPLKKSASSAYLELKHLLGNKLEKVEALIQSKLKLLALKKDSGILIPGHGGFYDRMDSVLFSAPFLFLFLMFLNYVS